MLEASSDLNHPITSDDYDLKTLIPWPAVPTAFFFFFFFKYYAVLRCCRCRCVLIDSASAVANALGFLFILFVIHILGLFCVLFILSLVMAGSWLDVSRLVWAFKVLFVCFCFCFCFFFLLFLSLCVLFIFCLFVFFFS